MPVKRERGAAGGGRQGRAREEKMNGNYQLTNVEAQRVMAVRALQPTPRP